MKKFASHVFNGYLFATPVFLVAGIFLVKFYQEAAYEVENMAEFFAWYAICILVFAIVPLVMKR